MTADSPFLTYDIAAEIAMVPKATIRYWVQLGKLNKYKPGRHPLIKREELIALIEASVQ